MHLTFRKSWRLLGTDNKTTQWLDYIKHKTELFWPCYSWRGHDTTRSQRRGGSWRRWWWGCWWWRPPRSSRCPCCPPCQLSTSFQSMLLSLVYLMWDVFSFSTCCWCWSELISTDNVLRKVFWQLSQDCLAEHSYYELRLYSHNRFQHTLLLTQYFLFSIDQIKLMFLHKKCSQGCM